MGRGQAEAPLGRTPPLLDHLRGMAPRRPVSPSEARRIAEHQASALLLASGVTRPAVPESVVTDLRFVHVRRWRGLTVSGMTVSREAGWEIVLDADEPLTRQRVTLLHELKHVLDEPSMPWLYPAATTGEAVARIERTCTYFAVCVLMPASWLLRDWLHGHRDVRRLACRYQVSAQAMHARLAELGLLAPNPNDKTTMRRLIRRAIEDSTEAQR